MSARLGVAVVVTLALGGRAAAHQMPSAREDNRYLKLVLLGDRVQLVYTILFGEAPGAQERRRMDGDHDGRIDDAEAKRFGDHVAAQIAGGLVIEVDGEARPVTWSRVDVGLGLPIVAAGSFAVDLVVWLPLATPRTRTAHDLWLRDHWSPPTPGETELFVEESPGVRAVRSTVGKGGGPSSMQFLWPTGDPPPLATEGIYVQLLVDPAVAPMQAASRHREPPARGGRAAVVLAAACVLAAAAGLWIGRRWAGKRRSTGRRTGS